MATGPRLDPGHLRRRAQEAALGGLWRGDDVNELVGAIAGHHVRGVFTPDVALLELAATALELACPAGAEALTCEGLRERYLPEVTFRGRVDHRGSQYALYAAACLRGGLQPDLIGDAGWWQSPLWTYALFAVVIYARAAAERLDLAVSEIAQLIAVRHHIDLPVSG